MPETPEIGNIIAYVALLIGILLALVALLASDLKTCPRIDQQIIIRHVLHLPAFIFGTSIIALVLLPPLFIPTLMSYFALPFFVILAVYSISVFLVFTRVIKWLTSSEFSTDEHSSYKETLRLNLLTQGNLLKKEAIWHNFWTYDYHNLDQTHIYRYLEACFDSLAAVPESHWHQASEHFCIMNRVLLDLDNTQDPLITHYMPRRLLERLDHTCGHARYQVREWRDLISSRVAHIVCIDDARNPDLVDCIFNTMIDRPDVSCPDTIHQINLIFQENFYPAVMYDNHQATTAAGLESLRLFKSCDHHSRQHQDFYKVLRSTIRTGNGDQLYNYLLSRSQIASHA